MKTFVLIYLIIAVFYGVLMIRAVDDGLRTGEFKKDLSDFAWENHLPTSLLKALMPLAFLVWMLTWPLQFGRHIKRFYEWVKSKFH